MSPLAHRVTLPRELSYELRTDVEDVLRRIGGAAFDRHSFERLGANAFVLNAEPDADKTGASLVGRVHSRPDGVSLSVRRTWRPTPTQVRVKLLVFAGMLSMVGTTALLTSHFSWPAFAGGMTGMLFAGWTWSRSLRHLQRMQLLQLVEHAIEDVRVRPDLGPFRGLRDA